MCPNCFHSYNWRKNWFKKTDLWICVQKNTQAMHFLMLKKEILRLPTSWSMVQKTLPPFPGWMASSQFQRPKVVTFINHQKPHVSLQGDWRFWCSILSKCCHLYQKVTQDITSIPTISLVFLWRWRKKHHGKMVANVSSLVTAKKMTRLPVIGINDKEVYNL